MSKLNIVTIILLFTILFCVPQAALAEGLDAPAYGDEVIFGGDFELEQGETMDGTLVVFGGDVYIRENAYLNGDLVNFGGNVVVDGNINGELVAIGGNVFLSSDAVVEGDVIAPGASIEISSGARVYGDKLVDFGVGDFTTKYHYSSNNFVANQISEIFWFIFKSFALAAVAVVVMVFIPQYVEHVTDVFLKNTLVSGGVGFAVLIVSVPLIVILAITIVLCLVGFGLGAALFLAAVFGKIAIGYEIGKRLKASMSFEMTDPLWAGIGTLILALVVGSVGMVPCIGWTLDFLVTSFAVGAVVLALFTARTKSTEVVEVPPVG